MASATTEIKKSTPGRPKSAEKRKQILESAGELFLSHGYERTSMEMVAKSSDVSKQTVYSHFKNKDALYNAVIESKCIAYQLETVSICDASRSLRSILTQFADKFIRLLSDEQVIAMYNAVIGEASNAPHVAKLFYDAGPVHSIELICQLFQNHPESQLEKNLAHEAAVDFFNLLKGEYHMRSLLHMPFQLDDAAIQRKANRCAQKTVLIIRHLMQ
uniref:TetR/AcrR family transcriptional regulator n=1 Tax=Ningiella ruwaisensis TaxID=2364274 RepID=UPI0010A00F3F|nr:TetR/AcrR family transcriptional regulator [Ningiella ruwaisensis]